MLTLKGRGAIVSGTRRIGATVARRLAQEGVRIALTYRNSRDEAEALAKELRELTDKVALVQADLSIESAVENLVQEAKRELGDLSFCVNFAYDYPRKSMDELDGMDWDVGMAGAKANYLMALHAYRAMLDNEGPTRGHLIFCGDWASDETPYDDYLPYLTGKAAVHFMTRAFGRGLGEHGILVNCIAPGPTAFGVGLTDRAWQRAISFTPLGRQSSDEDIAEMICTLLRLETITGEVIRIDSGRHVVGSPLREH
jgi:NAD(P)-dependent dehydrogenase (short-subunit alcohol dehydrogenase family)